MSDELAGALICLHQSLFICIGSFSCEDDQQSVALGYRNKGLVDFEEKPQDSVVVGAPKDLMVS